MARILTYNQDGTVASTTDTSAPSGGGSGGSSNGATGAIAASSITNSGDTSLTGALNVSGNTTLAATSAQQLTLTSGGILTFADGTKQTTAPSSGASTFMGAMYGPTAQLTTATALSATPVVLTQPNSATIATYVPNQTSYLLGGSLYVPAGTAQLELWDQTAGVSIYKTASYSAGSSTQIGPFPVGGATLGGYQLTAGNTYVWRATGSGSAVCFIDPIYYDKVNAGIPGTNFGVTTMTTSQANAVTTSYAVCKMVGNASYVKYLRPGKLCYLNNVTITNNGTSGYVTAYCCVVSSGSPSTVLAYASDASGTTRQVQPGETWTSPSWGNQYQFTLNTNYAWAVAGTSNGSVTITHTVLQ